MLTASSDNRKTVKFINLQQHKRNCTTFHRYPIFSKRYSVLCKVYTGYCGTSEIEHGLCACTVDNPLAKARGLSLRTGAQPMLYLSLIISTLNMANINVTVVIYPEYSLATVRVTTSFSRTKWLFPRRPCQ